MGVLGGWGQVQRPRQPVTTLSVPLLKNRHPDLRGLSSPVSGFAVGDSET